MKIVVIGSSNIDMVAQVSHLPAPGETVGDALIAGVVAAIAGDVAGDAFKTILAPVAGVISAARGHQAVILAPSTSFNSASYSSLPQPTMS